MTGTIAVRAHYADDDPEDVTVEVVEADDYAEVSVQLYEEAQQGRVRGLQLHETEGGTVLVFGTPPWPRVVYRVRGASHTMSGGGVVLVERIA